MKKTGINLRRLTAAAIFLPCLVAGCSDTPAGSPLDWDAALTRANTLSPTVFSDPGAGTIGPDSIVVNDGLRFDDLYTIDSVTPADNAASYRWMANDGDGWYFALQTGPELSRYFDDDPLWRRQYCRVAVNAAGNMLFSNTVTVTDIAFENEPPKDAYSYREPFDAGAYGEPFVYRRKFNTFGRYFYGEDVHYRYNGNYAVYVFTLERAMEVNFYVQTFSMPRFGLAISGYDNQFNDYSDLFIEDHLNYEIVNEDSLEPLVTYVLEAGTYESYIVGIRNMNWGIINDLIYLIIEGRPV